MVTMVPMIPMVRNFQIVPMAPMVPMALMGPTTSMVPRIVPVVLNSPAPTTAARPAVSIASMTPIFPTHYNTPPTMMKTNAFYIETPDKTPITFCDHVMPVNA